MDEGSDRVRIVHGGSESMDSALRFSMCLFKRLVTVVVPARVLQHLL